MRKFGYVQQVVEDFHQSDKEIVHESDLGSNYWSQGRTQEIKERVLHL